jgi:hypothetical protein
MAKKSCMIKIKKTAKLDEYYKKATKELNLLKRYKRWRWILSIGASLIVSFWVMNNVTINMNEDILLLFALWVVLVLMAAGIDNLLGCYYNSIIHKENLEVNNFESESFEKFSTEIHNAVADEVKKQGYSHYLFCDLQENKNEYVCYVFVWSEK